VSEERTRPAAYKTVIWMPVPDWSFCSDSETSMGNGRPIQVQAFPCFARYWLIAFLKLLSLGFLASLQAARETTPARRIRENLRIKHPPEHWSIRAFSRSAVQSALVDFDFESQQPREEIID
jgi:hypothetical protein